MTESKVINSPASRMCARVDCVHGRQSSSRSGFIDKPNSSQSTPARVRVREGLPPIANPAAYFKAWREIGLSKSQFNRELKNILDFLNP